MHRIYSTASSIVLSLTCAASAMAAAASQLDKLIDECRWKQIPELKTAAEKILKMDPKNGEAHAMLGIVKYAEKDPDGALVEYRQAIDSKMKNQFWNRSAHNYLYHVYIDKQDWKTALPLCLECYKIEPSWGPAHDLTLLYKKLGDTTKAAEWQKKADDYQAADKAKVKQLTADMKMSHDPKQVDALLARLNKNIEKDSADGSSLSLRVHCYITKKEYPKAIADMDELIKSRPGLGPLYARRAEIYKMMGDNTKYAADIKAAKVHGYDIENIQKIQRQVQELNTKGGGNLTIKDAKGNDITPALNKDKNAKTK